MKEDIGKAWDMSIRLLHLKLIVRKYLVKSLKLSTAFMKWKMTELIGCPEMLMKRIGEELDRVFKRRK